MDVKCRKTTCKYNKTHNCMAKKNLVEADTQCVTYEKDTRDNILENNKHNDMSKTLFQKKIKDAPYRSRRNIVIECKADCLFNKNGKCQANGITVNDLQTPYCITFLKR